MPSLNVAAYIGQCIESVCSQTLQDIEIICVDAGSTDGTRKIIFDFAQKDNRIKIIDVERKSYGYQVNVGIKESTGEYIAIVETDDIIKPFMLEDLYYIAVKQDLDFVKSQRIDCCYLNTNVLSERIFRYGIPETNFDKVLKRDSLVELQCGDLNIWNGIYRRSFLIKNNIVANETKGAAFQDIGFLQQVYRYAESGWFSSAGYYQYIVNRPGSSTVSARGASFVQSEFDWLLNDIKILKNASDEYKKAFVKRMVSAFICEFGRTSYIANPFSHEEIKGLNDWFVNYISIFSKQGLISREDYSDYLWLLLQLLLTSYTSYLDFAAVQYKLQQEKDLKIIEGVNDKPVVIFGCGIWGKSLKTVFERNCIEIAAFCDNNEVLWNTKLEEHDILSPACCIEKYENAIFYIANKKYGNDIKKQLLDLGILEERIKVVKL